MRAGLLLLTLLLSGCQADPYCRAHNAADIAPTAELYRSMSDTQRREDASRFNELARRCGWEP